MNDRQGHWARRRGARDRIARVPRSRFLAAVGLAAIVVLVSDVVVVARREEKPARPNVLIIVTDDQRTDQVDHMTHTERIFGDGGMYFSQAFATTPVCCPSRASIFTGQYPHNHGVWTNLLPEARRLDQDTTIQHHLAAEGYQTGIAGKYLNSWNLDVPPPDFDSSAIMLRGYTDTDFSINGSRQTIEQYSTDFIRDQAIAMLDQFEDSDDDPWFLYVAPAAPHFPYGLDPTDAGTDVGRFEPSAAVGEADVSDKPPDVRALQRVPPVTYEELWALQRRSLLPVDRMVENLFRKLEELGEQDTLAIFVSDNGYLLGEHGVSQDKRLPYPESVRVPLFMRWPGHVEAGAVDDRPVLNVDIAPTVLAAAGIEPRAAVDGRSLLGSKRRDRVLLEFYGFKASPRDVGVSSWASLWTPTAQYTEWYDETGLVIVFREFYDLTRDPAQLENLAADGRSPPSEAAAMAADLARYRNCRGPTGPEACP